MGKQQGKRYVDPMTPLGGDNLPLDFVQSSFNFKAPSRKNIGDTGSSQYVGDYYKPSSYDNDNMFISDLPNLNSIRAENQGFFPTIGNAIARTAINIIPTVIGNVASMLDIEDYMNVDNEVGNSVTRAMEEFKASVSKELPVYRENPNKSFDIGDPAWWIDNGASLVESISAFAITGVGVGAAFNAIGKGLSLINGLSKMGEAGKIAATVLTSAGLNQAESITTAMDVYDTTYKTSIENGLGEEEAKQAAADAASYSVNINRANILLNLTSSSAFIRTPKKTRQIRESLVGKTRKDMLSEGGQEYLEETINLVSQKEGERYGDALSKGKDYSYDFGNSLKDALSAEGIEAGVLGFIGGAGQTAVTKYYNDVTGETKRIEDLYKEQQESIARIQGLQNSGIVPDISSVFKTTEEITKLQNDIDTAIKNNDNNKVQELKYQLINTQISDALANGTVDKLENVYKEIEALSPEEAANKGFEIDPKSNENYKKQAAKAIQLIKDAEDGYLDIANKGYLNADEVLNNYIQGKSLSRLLSDINSDLNDLHTKAFNDKINLDIKGDLNADEISPELKALPSFQEYYLVKKFRDSVKNEYLKNIAEYAELTSTETQDKLKAEKLEKINKILEEAEKAKKLAEEEAVKKRRKEVYDKVNNATAPTNTTATNASEEAPVVNDEEEQEEQEEDSPESESDESVTPSGITDTTSVNDSEPLDSEMEYSEEGEIVTVDEKEVTDDDYLSTEEKVVANSVESEISDSKNKDANADGFVKDVSQNDEDDDSKWKRTEGNTIISLNVNYDEIITPVNKYNPDGTLDINSNFDSRLQSPNQFKPGDKVNIIFPTYDEMLERGVDNYTEEDYNNNINDPESFPIAFTDSNGKIIGYLPTAENVIKRVDVKVLAVELEKNRKLRQFLFDNKDLRFAVTITSKSNGVLLKTKGPKVTIYDALGDGTKLPDNVKLAVYKDGSLQTSLGVFSNVPLSNKKKLKAGYTYAILPTASGEYIAVPLNVSKVNENAARTVLKLLQLYKASTKRTEDVELIKEREELDTVIDIANTTSFLDAISKLIYRNSNIDNDTNLFILDKNKLILGPDKDSVFTRDQIMYDKNAQERIVAILTSRFPAVQLSNFGKAFNQLSVNNNKLIEIKHNNYFDYLNKEGILKTNVKGYPIDGEPGNFYYTAQSVITFSNPYIDDSKDVVNTEAAVTKPGDVVQANTTAPENSTSIKKPINKLGIKYKPNNNNNTNLREDFNFLNNLESKDIDTQAKELLKKCQK